MGPSAVNVILLHGDQPGLRQMLIRADYDHLARDLLDQQPQPWMRVYVATSTAVVGLLRGRFDEPIERHYAPDDHPPPQAWIYDIVTDPDHRRCGIGSALISRFVADAAKAGATWVALGVNLQDREGLDVRLAFFQRLGFDARTTTAGYPDVMGASIAALNQTLRATS